MVFLLISLPTDSYSAVSWTSAKIKRKTSKNYLSSFLAFNYIPFSLYNNLSDSTKISNIATFLFKILQWLSFTYQVNIHIFAEYEKPFIPWTPSLWGSSVTLHTVTHASASLNTYIHYTCYDFSYLCSFAHADVVNWKILPFFSYLEKLSLKIHTKIFPPVAFSRTVSYILSLEFLRILYMFSLQKFTQRPVSISLHVHFSFLGERNHVLFVFPCPTPGTVPGAQKMFVLFILSRKGSIQIKDKSLISRKYIKNLKIYRGKNIQICFYSTREQNW